MTTATKTITAPALLTTATETEVSEALLRHATRTRPDAVLVEHGGVVPPVAPESVTYRRGPLEVEELSWSAGAAKVSQRIDVWVPDAPLDTDAGTRTAGAMHAALGEVEKVDRQARLGDGTTVITGTYTVEVFPHVPLIEGRTEETVREALNEPRRLRKVGKIGPVEGTPEHRHQVVELSITTAGNIRGALEELRGTSTAAGYISEVGELDSWHDKIGEASFATASPSRERVISRVGLRLTWRER